MMNEEKAELVNYSTVFAVSAEMHT